MTQPTTVEAPELAEAYLVGFDAGRKQAAADIRAKAAGMVGSQYRNFEMAARIAESGK